MKLDFSTYKTIQEVREDFTRQYPFLKLEFYNMADVGSSMRAKKRLPHSTLLRSAGLKNPGFIEIYDEMTVGELEKTLMEQFGLAAQVSRNSAGVWLETTMTDSWSLGKQNKYGHEIIQLPKKNIPDFPDQ
jgi:hypothetical protein